MRRDEWVLVAALAWLVSRGRGGSSPVEALPGLDWHWPLATMEFAGTIYPAVVTQEYQAGKHFGQDIAYRRGTGVHSLSVFKAGSHDGTRAFVCPPGAPVLAAASGAVKQVKAIATGMAVVVGHGDGWETLYLHLAAVEVKEGDAVRAGQKLGEAGWDPKDPEGFRHLHFVVRHGNQTVFPTGQTGWRRRIWVWDSKELRR